MIFTDFHGFCVFFGLDHRDFFIAPPGATFQINVRPPLRMVSGVSASAKIVGGDGLGVWQRRPVLPFGLGGG